MTGGFFHFFAPQTIILKKKSAEPKKNSWRSKKSGEEKNGCGPKLELLGFIFNFGNSCKKNIFVKNPKLNMEDQ